MNKELIEELARKHLKYQEESPEVSGVFEFSAALLADFDCCLALLRSWCAGNGDERFVTKEHVRELIEATGEFLKKYPLERPRIE